MQQGNTKHYYVGRREFVEVLDQCGSVSERRFTGYDFGDWFVSNVHGTVLFKGRVSQPSWAELVKDGRPHECDVAGQIGVIADYAPPGFQGRYMPTREPHCRVPPRFYFRTFGYGVVAALDTEGGNFYISTHPFDEILRLAADTDLAAYCRRFLGKRTVTLNCIAIPGVVGGPFAPLDAIRPLLADAGEASGRRIRALSVLARELRGVEDIGAAKRTSQTARAGDSAARARIIVNPQDGNEFKVSLHCGGDVVYCAKARIDPLDRRAVIGCAPAITELCAKAKELGLGKVNTLYTRVAPILNCTLRAGGGVRCFYSHGMGRWGARAARMYADVRGNFFVNLRDLLEASRVDVLHDLSQLLADDAIVRCDLPYVAQVYDTNLALIPDSAFKVFCPDGAMVPLFQAVDFFDAMVARHGREGTRAFRRGPPYAMKCIHETFCVNETDYNGLKET